MYVCRAILFLIHMATDAVALSIDWILFRVTQPRIFLSLIVKFTKLLTVLLNGFNFFRGFS